MDMLKLLPLSPRTLAGVSTGNEKFGPPTTSGCRRARVAMVVHPKSRRPFVDVQNPGRSPRARAGEPRVRALEPGSSSNASPSSDAALRMTLGPPSRPASKYILRRPPPCSRGITSGHNARSAAAAQTPRPTRIPGSFVHASPSGSADTALRMHGPAPGVTACTPGVVHPVATALHRNDGRCHYLCLVQMRALPGAARVGYIFESNSGVHWVAVGDEQRVGRSVHIVTSVVTAQQRCTGLAQQCCTGTIVHVCVLTTKVPAS